MFIPQNAVHFLFLLCVLMIMRHLKLFPILLALYEMLAYLSNDIYLPALPALSRTFGINTSIAQLTLTTWLLGAASMQLILGPVSDRYGRRPVLLWGGLVFIIATLICAASPNITTFLIARFFQGCAVCSIIVAGYASIHEIYDQKTAMRTLAMMMSITVTAPAFGPLLGSFFLQFVTWRFLFYFLVISAVIVLTPLFKGMPESHPPEKRQAISLPLIGHNYKTVLINSGFMLNVLVVALIKAGMLAWIATGPFLVIEKFGYSPIFFGLFQVFVFGGFVLGGRCVKRGLDRFGPLQLIFIGLIIALLSSCLVLVAAYLKASNLWYLVFCLTGLTFGNALLMGPLQRLAIDAATEAPMGARMAIYSSLMAGSGVLGSLLAATFYIGTSASLAWIILIVTWSAGLLRFGYTFKVSKKSS